MGRHPLGADPLRAALCIALFSLVILGGTAHALTYVDASPAGTAFPEWEGGDTELEFADVNADGHVDFVSIGDHGSPYINSDEHGIMVYFGDGAGGWSLHMEGDFGYGGIAIGDVDNDGLLDAAYAMHHNYSGIDFGNQLIEVARGDGTGMAWTPWDDGLATGGESYGMFATDLADFDGDGDLDLASNSFGASNGVHVYRNNGDGSWAQTWARTGGNAQAHLTCADIDNDGYPDIGASYQYGTIFLGDGAGGFSAADTGLPAAGASGLKGVSLGDVDGDGCADLAFTKSGGVYVYLWRGTQWVNASAGLPASGECAITQLWDMNLDGWVDVVALGGGSMTVWLGDGGAQWASAGTTLIADATDTAAFQVGGDVDHNGYPDVVLVQEQGSFPTYQNHLYVYRESSAPAERRVVFQCPRGNETLLAGSVRTIRWSAAQIGAEPAAIRIELSVAGPDGPWAPVATALPDGGHWQWIVPATPSATAHLRITQTQAGESVAAVSRAFRILPSGAAGVDDAGQPPADWTQAPAPCAWPALRLRLAPNPLVAGQPMSLELTIPQGDNRGGSARVTALPGALAGATSDARAVLVIHDAAGREIRRLAVERAGAIWDGLDARGRPVSPGAYWASLRGASGGASGDSDEAATWPEVARRFVVLR